MQRYERARDWLDERKLWGLDAVRMFLGAALFVRGVLFIKHTETVVDLTVGQGGDWFFPMALLHYVAPIHLAGGLFLALGLFTRFAAAFQAPILLGAVFFVHLRDGLLSRGQSLELAALTLVLLLAFSVFGSGPLSVDAWLTARQKQREAEGVSEDDDAKFLGGKAAGHS